MTTKQVIDRGSLIRLEGLIKGVHLNGCTGTILVYVNKEETNGNDAKKSESSSPEGGRYQVKLDDNNGSKVVLVKQENVVPISFVESMTLQGYNVVECTPSFLDTSSDDNNNVILGGGRHIPSEHIDFLPRQAELPRRKLSFHNDVAKKCFFQIHEGDFVAAWKFVREDDKRKSIVFRFGLKKKDDNNNNNNNPPLVKRGPLLLLARLHVVTALTDYIKALETEEFVSSKLMDQEGRVYLAKEANSLVAEFATGFSTDTLNQLVFRVLHHVLRQHGANFPIDIMNGLYSIMCPFYMSKNNEDSNSKNVKKNKLLEYLDLQVVRADIETSEQGFAYSDRYADVAHALEAVEEYELAGRVYVRTAEKFRGEVSALNAPWILYQNGGIAFRRAKMFQPSEHSYIKALQDKFRRDGNRLLIDDPHFRSLMTNMVSMYSYFAVGGDRSTGGSSTSTSAGNQMPFNDQFVGILVTLLHVSGFHSHYGSLADMSKVNALKPQYRKTSAARTVLRDAIQISCTSVDAFHSKILDCMENDNNDDGPFEYLQDTDLTTRLEIQNRLARDRARGVVQKNCSEYMAQDVMRCVRPGCKKLEISDMTATANDGGGKLMQCPCRTVSYCSKECQTAHWKEHKKVCPVHQAKVKEKNMSRGKEQSG